MTNTAKSLKFNSILNTTKTLMSLIFPLISYPYALRVLQIDNIGKDNVAISIANYIALIAELGISNYASREGARKRNDKIEFERFAGKMFTINLFSTAFAYIVLFILLGTIKNLHPYSLLIIIHSFTVIGTLMGMDWINVAQEEYTYITIRTISFQIISMILLFLFVKSVDDIIIYAGISAFSNVGANVANFIHIRKHMNIKVSVIELKPHLIPIFWLFASSIARVIYVNSDTTMLGIMCGDRSAGLYGASSKIYTIVDRIIAASIVVALPRLSNYLACGEEQLFKKTVNKVFANFSIILFPMMVGLFIFSREVIEIIGGENYADATDSLRILSFSLGFSVFGIFFTNAILFPMKREKDVSIITIISALVNFGLNLIFIPLAAQNGAAITTVIAEAIVMLSQYYVVRKEKLLHVHKAVAVQVFLGCTVIVAISLFIKHIIINTILKIIFGVLFSVLGYAITLLAMKNDIAINIVSDLKKRFHINADFAKK